MGYISEDYCSEELSGMLMERGYIGAANTYLGKDDINVKQITLQSAMKWLREVHNLSIEPYYDFVLNWLVDIKYIGRPTDIREFEHIRDNNYDSYEEACEAAIKYCLENLI